MKLLIKQRLFTWRDSYDVYDESGEARYTVRSELFSMGHQLHVYDRNQKEAGVIHQKLLAFLPAFEIEVDGIRKGTIQKQFSLFKPRYEIDYNGWRVEGDVFGWDYDVYSGAGVVVHISKELLHWGDTYVIDFGNPADELDGLLLVLAIDAANCSQD